MQRTHHTLRGELIDLTVKGAEREALILKAGHLASVQLSVRSTCDLELLATGAFSPLDTFMNEEDYLSVVETMRLANGVLFPIPITLSVQASAKIEVGQEVALRNAKNELLAVIKVEDVFSGIGRGNLVSGTTDVRHPLVANAHGRC